MNKRYEPSDKQHEVMGLYLAGYSYKDIAETLEIPLNTVRTRLHYGRKSNK